MKKYFMAICSICLTSLFLFAGAPGVFAQEDEFTLEEVIVTAEKRGEENIQKLSIATTVIDGVDMQEAHLETLSDVLKNVPNLVTATGGYGYVLSIRGVGMNMSSSVAEAAVSAQFDGAHQKRTESTLFGYFDIDHVEVLRGPQGTLYGRNATGGVVNVISRKPQMNVVEGYAKADFGNYNQSTVQGALNIPISDNWAARAAVAASKGDSFTEDSSGWRNTQMAYGTRLQVRYEPSDDASVNLMANLNNRTGSRGMDAVAQEDWVAGNYRLNEETSPYNRTSNYWYRNFMIQANVDLPLGPGIITFIPTYEHVHERSNSYGLNRRTGEGELSSGGRFGWETTTGELRYASKSDSKVEWVGGLYYQDITEPGTPRDDPAPQEGWQKAKAVFGQMSYPLTDTFNFILGARYDEDTKGYERDLDLDPTSASYSFSYFDWKAGFEKNHTENVMSYFTLSTGHKPGGYNSYSEGETFDEESLLSAEYGLKSRFMDQRLQVNASIFYYDYKDYQCMDMWEEFDEDLGYDVTVTSVFNVPSSSSSGVELETTYLMGEFTLLDFSMTYLKTEYTCDYYLHKSTTDAPTNMNGKPFPHSPEFTFNGGIEHTFMLNSGASLRPKLSARWHDDTYISPYICEEGLQKAYSVVDCSLTYNSIHNWGLTFYSTNVFDEIYASGGHLYAKFPGPPREIGVSFNMSF